MINVTSKEIREVIAEARNDVATNNIYYSIPEEATIKKLSIAVVGTSGVYPIQRAKELYQLLTYVIAIRNAYSSNYYIMYPTKDIAKKGNYGGIDVNIKLNQIDKEVLKDLDKSIQVLAKEIAKSRKRQAEKIAEDSKQTLKELTGGKL